MWSNQGLFGSDNWLGELGIVEIDLDPGSGEIKN